VTGDLERQLDRHLLDYLNSDEQELLQGLLARTHTYWSPLPGPQTEAFESDADVVGYGGAAGGGKTDLAIGLALTQHQKVGIFRETGPELTAVIDRIGQILGTTEGYSGKDRIWRTRRADGVPVQIELGSFPNPGDERKYRGRPHDLLVFDEAADMRESAMRFVSGWLRTTDPEQRCRTLICFNPPTSVEGRWVVRYFAPWIDSAHPNPASPGELRWFVTVDDVDREVAGPGSVEIEGKMRTPHSRTFIPSRVKDNPFLAGTGYEDHLDSLPEPLRTQMKEGDFSAGMEDDPYQVVPTHWVDAAMQRWERPDVLPEMHSVGVDVAMGGSDKTVIARRHGMWFDQPITYSGRECIDGATIAGFVVAAMRDRAVIHIDLFGVGAQPFGHLMRTGHQVRGINVGDPSGGVTRSGAVRFYNLRSELWWRMREALDPNANTGIKLPPSNALLADLCAPKWELQGGKIKVQSREDIVKTIGRSPDYGSAYCLALIETMKARDARVLLRGGQGAEYDPFAKLT
jgi:hypothetical protein